MATTTTRARLWTIQDAVRHGIDDVRRLIPRVDADVARGDRTNAAWLRWARRVASLEPDTATAADVNKAAGAQWVRLNCDGCERDVEAAVQFGGMDGDAGPDEMDSLLLCADCLASGAALLRGSEPHAPAR